MKISAKDHIVFASSEAKKIESIWSNAAEQVSLEYGIRVQTDREIQGMLLARIYFKVMEHEFDSLRDLKRALENKAFI